MRILTDVQIELAHDMEMIAEALAGGFKLPPRKTVLDAPFAQKMRAEFEAENKKRNDDIMAKNAADAKVATDAAQKHFADEEQKRLAQSTKPLTPASPPNTPRFGPLDREVNVPGSLSSVGSQALPAPAPMTHSDP